METIDKVTLLNYLHQITNQMTIGAYRLMKIMLSIVIILSIICAFYLLFKSGVVPTVDLKTAKHISGIIKPVHEILM